MVFWNRLFKREEPKIIGTVKAGKDIEGLDKAIIGYLYTEDHVYPVVKPTISIFQTPSRVVSGPISGTANQTLRTGKSYTIFSIGEGENMSHFCVSGEVNNKNAYLGKNADFRFVDPNPYPEQRRDYGGCPVLLAHPNFRHYYDEVDIETILRTSINYPMERPLKASSVDYKILDDHINRPMNRALEQ